MDETARAIKEFVMTEFLPGEDAEELTEETLLFSAGLLDSIASLKLVSFLEDQFAIRVEAHEVIADNLDSINTIAAFVRSKTTA